MDSSPKGSASPGGAKGPCAYQNDPLSAPGRVHIEEKFYGQTKDRSGIARLFRVER